MAWSTSFVIADLDGQREVGLETGVKSEWGKHSSVLDSYMKRLKNSEFANIASVSLQNSTMSTALEVLPNV